MQAKKNTKKFSKLLNARRPFKVSALKILNINRLKDIKVNIGSIGAKI